MKDSTDYTEEEWKEVQFIRERSPYFYADKVKTPLLYFFGKRDFILKEEEVLNYLDMLRENGVEVQYVAYPDETRGLEHWDNKVDATNKIEIFLANHLGGRVLE